MESKNLIPINQLCKHYKISISFIKALQEYELLETVNFKETQCIKTDQIRMLEKMMNLHYDLEINFEGIDAIHNLLKQVEALQNKIITLDNRLRFFQD